MPKSESHAVSTDRIKTIVAESFNDEIDDKAAEVLTELLDDMLDSIVQWSVKVAESREVNQLDIDDVRFTCEQDWGIALRDSNRSSSNSGISK